MSGCIDGENRREGGPEIYSKACALSTEETIGEYGDSLDRIVRQVEDLEVVLLRQRSGHLFTHLTVFGAELEQDSGLGLLAWA